MTPRSQSQPKANDDHGDRHGRKFMLVGIAAFLATAITMSAGLMLTNKAKAHLRKERQAYEMVDKLAAYESNSVGPYHLVLDIHSPNWSGIIDSIQSVREHAERDHGWMFFTEVKMKDGGYFTPFFVGDAAYATAILTSGPKAEAVKIPDLSLTGAESPACVSTANIDRNAGKVRSSRAKPLDHSEFHGEIPRNHPGEKCTAWEWCDQWKDDYCSSWGPTVPKERP